MKPIAQCPKTIVSIAFCCIFSISAIAQGVGINNDGSEPHSSAILDVKSTTQGMLIPRMTTAERTAIESPATGLMVYDLNTASFWYYDGAWRNLNNNWSLNGNDNVDPATHFIGTTTNSPLVFKVGSVLAGTINPGNQSASFGIRTLPFSSTGLYNAAFGHYALEVNTSGARNAAFGVLALRANTLGQGNTAVGYSALSSNTAGSNNVALGNTALSSNSIGQGNAAVGYAALGGNLTGGYNVAFGYNAMQGNKEGAYNVATGGYSMLANNTGYYNVATGYAAMTYNVSGHHNVAVGSGALYTNSGGNENTAIGNFALGNSLGDRNTALGFQSLTSNTVGTYNTAVGAFANVGAGNLTNATAIGYGATVTASNKVRIGNSAVTVIEGQVPFTTPSDGRFKFNIEENVKGLDFIMRLRPVTYQFDVKRFDDHDTMNNDNLQESMYSEALNLRRTGFIAQEVEKAAQEAGFQFSGLTKPSSPDGYYSLSYESFVVPLVKGMQEQQQQIKQQQAQLDELKKENEELRKMIKQLLDKL